MIDSLNGEKSLVDHHKKKVVNDFLCNFQLDAFSFFATTFCKEKKTILNKKANRFEQIRKKMCKNIEQLTKIKKKKNQRVKKRNCYRHSNAACTFI